MTEWERVLAGKLCNTIEIHKIAIIIKEEIKRVVSEILQHAPKVCSCELCTRKRIAFDKRGIE